MLCFPPPEPSISQFPLSVLDPKLDVQMLDVNPKLSPLLPSSLITSSSAFA